MQWGELRAVESCPAFVSVEIPPIQHNGCTRENFIAGVSSEARKRCSVKAIAELNGGKPKKGRKFWKTPEESPKPGGAWGIYM